MTPVYDELIDFIAAGSSPAAVAAYSASRSACDRVERLIESEKAGNITSEEKSELDHYLQLEHVMRLAKARAHLRLSP